MSGCVRSTRKKYAKRPSPPFPANQCHGQTMEGNDGTMYKSVPDKRGIHTWKKVGPASASESASASGSSSKTRKAAKGKGIKGNKGNRYEVHNNGARPYTVEDFPSKKHVVIYKNEYDDNDVKTMKEVTAFKYMNLWTSSPKSDQFGEWEKGNTVLIQKDNSTFMVVWYDLIKFRLEPGDSVEEYMSYIGNNDVPYAWITGKSRVYFLNEYVSVEKSLVDLKDEPYSQLWGSNGALKANSKKMKLV